ncbi:MAG TPA: type III-B CRISPR-associated protein Cas10/Cmr2, partial [Bacillota bacterium]|nr:type III-B CRISPR-associated protein Cas10/Cmr2 [Bacillota bacterium]
MSAYIDYSIGPVQIFVAQSRRTRDLWGSSYLLSVLAGYAMLGAIRAGGQIVRPKVDQDPLFMCISGRRHGSAPAV